MIKKSNSSIPGHVCITFELPASLWADRIFLTGDFNNWHAHNLPLKQTRDGIWSAALDLPADRRYEFRYLIDGQGQVDRHADGCSSDISGQHSSIVDTFLPIAQSQPQHRNLPLQKPVVRVQEAAMTV